MKKTVILLAFALVAAISAYSVSAADGEKASDKTRVLIVTGGHEFEREAFFDMFKSFDDVVIKNVEHPEAAKFFNAEAAKDYDVIVLYDMWEDLPDDAKKGLTEILCKQGKGLVALHHCLASYQDWPVYAKIIGGKYYLEKPGENEPWNKASTYKHGVTFEVKVAASEHPVTEGLDDFTITDETYGQFYVADKVTPLLKTSEPTSNDVIAWAKKCGYARVVYIQLGHDHLAYENPNYRKLVHQAINWTAKSD